MHHRQRLAVGTTLVAALIAPFAIGAAHAEPVPPSEAAATTGFGTRHPHKAPDTFIGAGGDSAKLAATLQAQAKGRKITQLDIDVSAVALTADGTLLAAGEEPDVADMLKQAKGRRIIQVSTADGVMAALTADGNPLIADPKKRVSAADLLIKTRGHKITQITVTSGGVLALTDDGKLHLVGESGWTGCLLEQAQGQKVTSIAGGHGFLALAEGGRLLASGAQSAEIMKAAEGKRIVWISGGLSDAALADDGTFISTKPDVSSSIRKQAAGQKIIQVAVAHQEFLAVTDKSTFLLEAPYGKERAAELTRQAAGRPIAHIATGGGLSLAVVREMTAQPSAVRTHGDINLTAEAKTPFGNLRAQAVEDGKPVGDTDLKFEIVGNTAARFIVDGKPQTEAIVTTSQDGADTGWAKAPALTAGDRTGDFSIKVTSVVSPSATPAVYFMHVTEASKSDEIRLQFIDMKANPLDGPVKLQAKYPDKNEHTHIGSVMPGQDWVKFAGEKRLKVPFQLVVKQVNCPYRELGTGSITAVRDPKTDQLILNSEGDGKLPANMIMVHVKNTNQYVFTWRGTPKHGPAHVASRG
ncbi:hypothetical protein ACFU99_24675 [Streptomyces sp. NPDC057654]|uniref:hypothetical protein n=1 Tax=Streptomyces sp. NPDC057654 TaxID=3346196 RepID=UPI00367B632F